MSAGLEKVKAILHVPAVRQAAIYLAALHLLFALAWPWARSAARYELAVSAGPQKIRVVWEGVTLAAVDNPGGGGGIALRLTATEPYAPATVVQAWDNVRISALPSGFELFDDPFDGRELLGWTVVSGTPDTRQGELRAGGDGNLLVAAGGADWTEYELEAELSGGREAEVQILRQDGQNYVSFALRPFRHRDAVLKVVRDGAAVTEQRMFLRTPPGNRLAMFGLKLLMIYARTAVWTAGGAFLLTALLWAARRPGLERFAQRTVARRLIAGTARCWPWAAAGAAVIISTTICLAVLRGIPHVQDSVAYLFQAKIFASGRLWATPPPLPDFFAHQFILFSGGKTFTQYPYGYPALLAAGQLLGAPWLVNPLLGGASLLLLARLGRGLYGAATGHLAVLLAVCSPFVLLMNGSFMSHTAGLFYTLLALTLTIVPGSKAGAVRGAAAGLALTLLGATRPLTAPPVGLIVGIAVAGRLVRERPRPWRLAAGLAAGAAAGVALYLSYNAALTGDPFLTTYDKYLGQRYVGTTIGFGGQSRHDLSNAVSNLDTLTSSLMMALFRWPAFWTLAPMLWFVLQPRLSPADRLMVAGLAAIPGVYFFYYNTAICYGPRYYFEALPFILLLTARGVLFPLRIAAGLLDSSGPQRPSRSGAGERLLVIALFAGAALSLVQDPRGHARVIDRLRAANRLSTGILDSVEREGLDRAVVFVHGVEHPWDWIKYGSVYPQNTPDFDGAVVYARSLGFTEDQRLMTAYPGRSFYLAHYPSGELVPYTADAAARWDDPAEPAAGPEADASASAAGPPPGD